MTRLTVEGLDFIDSKLEDIALIDIKRLLDGKKDFESLIFDKSRKIYELGGNCFLIEFNNKILRDSDKILFDKYFNKKGYFSEEKEGGLQIPEFVGEFDYRGNYYFILEGLNRLLDITDDISYKGVIINISKYLENTASQKVISTSTKVGEILN